MSVGAEQDNVCLDIVVVSQNVIDTDIIKNHFAQTMHVDAISFESDVVLQQEEFEHLFSFSKNKQIQSDDLIAALELCSKKNKLFTVKMTVFTGDEGARLHITFSSAWTF